MDSFKATLAKQKMGLSQATGSVPIIPNTETPPTAVQAPLDEAPSPHVATSFVPITHKGVTPITGLNPLHAAPPHAPAEATSRLHAAEASPPASPQQMPLPPAQSMGPPSFTTLTEKQLKFSNTYIRNMSYKAEMLTYDEVLALPKASVVMHDDGVLRYHRELHGEILQTPLFLMGSP